MGATLCVQCCAGFAAEVRAAVAAEGFDDVQVVPFAATCARPPVTLDDIARRRVPGADTVVVGGACVACTARRADRPADTEVLCLSQCLALVAGDTRVERALARRAYCVTPGWLADWRGRLADMGLTPSLAAACFGEFASAVLLFDTGTDPEAPAHLVEFGAEVGLPVQSEGIGLDLVRAQVANLVLRWRLRRVRADADERHRREARAAADYATAMDMLVRVAKAHDEDEVHRGIVGLFEVLFAPRELRYVRVVGEHWEPSTPMPADALAQLRALAGGQPCQLVADGFLLQLLLAGQPVAAVAVHGLAFPEYRERYLSLALSVAEVGSLAIGYARRQAELVAARDEAQAASRAKTAFLATMSHELRTPLNGVLGMTELALLRATDTKQREYLATSQKSARHLLAIISDVLDFAQLESGDVFLERGEFTLSALLDAVTGAYAPEAARKGLRFRAELDPADAGRRFVGDARRLEQALGHLVANAVKFTAAGSVAVRVTVSPAAAGEARVRLEVEDTGIGIAPQDQARLFRKFEQLDVTYSRAYGGTGIGLAIAQRLARLMGGEIGLRSEAGAGSTFWLTARLGVPSGGAASGLGG